MKTLVYLFFVAIFFGCVFFLIPFIEQLGWFTVLMIFLASNFISNSIVSVFQLLTKDDENTENN